ncbi:unnamed protein product [Strongylus vulgaris]|uniref:PNPLA domain-containing protein n=1 Tax=Strongylus vulgaris TaxID=40348 RepID=A0A3P7IW38_STRVU|nr:unnamed protein product [Strongylus vulgaris]
MGSFSENGPRVIVTVADTRRSPANLVLFRSFAPKIPEAVREQLDYLDPDKILVWKAARCTCAAPFFFDSYNGLSDGGLVANNPTQALIADFLQTTRLEKEYASNKVSVVYLKISSVETCARLQKSILSHFELSQCEVELKL